MLKQLSSKSAIFIDFSFKITYFFSPTRKVSIVCRVLSLNSGTLKQVTTALPFTCGKEVGGSSVRVPSRKVKESYKIHMALSL